jgi:hypothetical protein
LNLSAGTDRLDDGSLVLRDPMGTYLPRIQSTGLRT